MENKSYSDNVREYFNNKRTGNISTNKTNLNKSSYSNSVNQYFSKKRIGFDTLQNDLTSLTKTIQAGYDGWQTTETMQNTLLSVQSMYERLGKYQEYQKQYGGADLSELQTMYKGVLDDWDSLSREYSKYKDADSYSKAIETAKKTLAEEKKMETDDLNVVQSEIDGLEKIAKDVRDREFKLQDAKTRFNTWNPDAYGNATNPQLDELRKQEKEYENYLKELGYSSRSEIDNLLGEKKAYLNRAKWKQKGLTLSSMSDEASANYDAQYDEYVAKGKAIPYDEVGSTKRTSGAGKARPRTIKSDTRVAAEALHNFVNGVERNGGTSSLDYHKESEIYSLMTEKEFNDFAYWIAKDKEDGGNRASEYLNTIKETLNSRRSLEISENLKGKMFSEYMFGVEAGLDQFSSGVKNLFNTEDEYIPVSQMQMASSQVRDDITYEHGSVGQVAYDLINTTSNMLPSILASTLAGKINPALGVNVGAALMGGSAAGNAYQEMINLGYDKGQARTYSTLVGVSEAYLQKMMGGISALGGTGGKIAKAVDSIDNALAKFSIRLGGSIASEAIEEGAQEILSPIFQNIVAGYDTADVDWGEVAYSALLGGLSGGVMEGAPLAVNSVAEVRENKLTGKDIRANDRINDMLDLASKLTPEQYAAYETYSRYAKKGINAENIKDAQLGRLYNESLRGTMEKGDLVTISKLGKITSDNTVAKEKAKLNVGEETKVTESGTKVNIQALRVQGEDVLVATEQGEISADKMTLSDSDADIVAYAKVKAQADGEIVANAFIENYDGKTNLEEYNIGFELVETYTKMGKPADFILNEVDVLTGAQISAIHESTIKAMRDSDVKIQQEAFAKAREFIGRQRGVIDDSVFAYKGNAKEGQVNWKDLSSRQRKAVTFANGLFTAMGNNVVWTVGQKYSNGLYSIQDNTIYIDAYSTANIFDNARQKDTIINTISHELTHQMEVYSPDTFKEVSDLILDALVKTAQLSDKSITRADLIANEIDRLDKAHPGEKHTDADAISEIVARACEDMLSESKAARELFNSLSESEQKALTDRIKDIIAKFKKWIDNLLKSYSSNSDEAKALRRMKDSFDEVLKKWNSMLLDIAEQNKATKESGKVIPLSEKFSESSNDSRYSDKNSDESESIKVQLKNNQEKLDAMDVIASVNTSKKFKNAKDAYDWAVEQLKQSGYKVDRMGFGTVIFDEKRLRNGLRYINTQSDYTAYAMIPKIIKRGIVIGEHLNHKDRGYNTITFGAPVEIDGTRWNMAVVIRMEGKNYYKLHKVLMPDGGLFEYKKGNNAERAAATQDVVDTPTDIVSKDNISHPEQKVKFSDKETEQSEKTFSYDELVAKDDLNGFVIGKDKQVKLNSHGNIDAQWVVNEVKKKCDSITTKAPNPTYYTNVPDIGRNVELSYKGITHGFLKSLRNPTKASSPRDILNARVTLEIPRILKNSIEVNRSLRVGNDDSPFSHVMIGTVGLMADNGDIEYCAVRTVIEERINQDPILVEAEILGKLHAINAKKIGTPSVQTTENGDALTGSVAYTYNVAQFLEDVKTEFNDTFSEDVYQKLGMQRFNNDFSKNLLFQDKSQESIYDIMGETDRVKKELKMLDEDANKFNQIIGTTEVENRKFVSLAKYSKKLSGSQIDVVEIAKRFKSIYSSLQSSDSLSWRDISMKTYGITQDLLSNDIGESVGYFKNVKQDIRKTKITLSKEQRARAEERFGGYGNFHKYMFGSINLTKSGTSLEDAWKTWSKKYPALFDPNITGIDQIEALVEAVDVLKSTSSIMDEYEYSEASRHLTTEIYNQFWNIAADSATTEEAYTYRTEHRAMMKNLRKNYENSQKDLMVHPVGESVLKYENLVRKVKERKKAEIAYAKQKGRERLATYKENAERKARIQSITANALTLNKWLTTNSKDYHIHEAMKGPVTKLLQALDFSSKRLLEGGKPTQNDVTFAKAFSEVKSMLEAATNSVPGLEALYGHELAKSIDLLSEAAFNMVGDNQYVINQMNSEELYHLDKLVRHIKKVVTDLNKFHTIEHNKGVYSLADEFMAHGEKIGNIKNQHGKWGKYFLFRNRTPYYFFKDLGEVGKKIFRAFQDGWDKLAFNAKKVIDFANETYTEKEVKEWGKETKEFTIKQLDGSERTFNMTIAQIMSLYCVAKQDDAITHLLSGGMTLKRIDKKGNVVADYENITLTIPDIQSIIGTLDNRQREVADKLQNFMNTVCSDWGNEISMARFGVKMFGITDYFPIKVSEATVPTDNTKDIDNASLFRLLNMSFTKARKDDAPQSIEIGDVFDIFAQHSSDMAKYNALALPVLDFSKFYSIHGKDAMGKEYGVEQTLKSVFGDEANTYLRRFVRDLNGSQNVSRDVVGNTFFKNAKVASVAGNLRVVLLQPTAFYKASAILDNKYLMKASAYIKLEPIGMVKKLKKTIANAEKYCGIVQWKSLGYYDTDISKGLTEKIKHSDGIKDKLVEKSLKGAELADKVTFGTLWVACEFEIRDTRKDLKVGSDEFYKAIAERLREVIYATQVVDSTMTRTDMMRSSDKFDKMLTTFGSEPAIAYNMLLDMATQYHRDKQEFGAKEARKRNFKKIRKVVVAYTMTNIMAALVESGFDMLRDDEEETDVATFLKLYFKNLAFDMSIANKLPTIKEFYSLLQGYSSSRMDTQWMTYVFRTHNDITKLAKGEGDWIKLLKDASKLGSDLSGIPIYNVLRDVLATLDKLGLLEELE